MKLIHTALLHVIIMAIATLTVAAITITYFYSAINELPLSELLSSSAHDEIHSLYIQAGLVAALASIFIIVIASSIFFRITLPMIQKTDQQAETFHTLAKTAHEAIFLINTQGIIQFINPAAENLFGYTADELLGKNINILMPHPHRKNHNSYIKNYLATGKRKIIGKGQQLVGKRKDDSQFPMYLSVGEIKLKHTHLFAGLIMDLSMQQKLQREILAIPAREQQRIGEELHDGLGQQLTGLSMLAQSLLNKASKPEHDLAEQLASGLHEALTQVRALSRGLMPVQIYADGFMISLQEITERIQQQSNIPIKVQIDDVVLLVDDATATHLYRIVQESLNNAIKHANASEITVSLKKEQNHGVLEVIDDGIGIPIDPDDSSGLGLSIMKHRCGLFDGEITINPRGKTGTKVCCRFPVISKETD